MSIHTTIYDELQFAVYYNKQNIALNARKNYDSITYFTLPSHTTLGDCEYSLIITYTNKKTILYWENIKFQYLKPENNIDKTIDNEVWNNVSYSNYGNELENNLVESSDADYTDEKNNTYTSSNVNRYSNETDKELTVNNNYLYEQEKGELWWYTNNQNGVGGWRDRGKSNGDILDYPRYSTVTPVFLNGEKWIRCSINDPSFPSDRWAAKDDKCRAELVRKGNLDQGSWVSEETDVYYGLGTLLTTGL